MRVLGLILAVAMVGVVIGGQAGVVSAQATRTWVSGVGDDANPCSRTAPCKTFAGAISKTAAGGEISVLDPGGFGAVTITKSITINGDGQLTGIVALATNGIVVNAGANDVVNIRNLTINGGGTGLNGVKFLQGAALNLDGVAVYGFRGSNGHGLDVEPVNAGAEVSVTNSVFMNNIAGGVLIHPTVTGSDVVRVSIERSAFVNNDSFGLRADDRSDVAVSHSVATGNGTNGFLAASAGAAVTLFLEDNMATMNGFAAGGGYGIRSSGALAVVRISDNVVTRNNDGITRISSGQMETFQNNYVTGNTNNVVGGAPTAVAKT